MLVSSTSGCYRNDFVDDIFSANLYNLVVGAVKSLRSDVGHQGVPLSYLLDFGEITGCKEAMFNNTRLDDPLRTSPWEGLSVRSRGALVALYISVIRESRPGVVFQERMSTHRIFSGSCMPDRQNRVENRGVLGHHLLWRLEKSWRKWRFVRLIPWRVRQEHYFLHKAVCC